MRRSIEGVTAGLLRRAGPCCVTTRIDLPALPSRIGARRGLGAREHRVASSCSTTSAAATPQPSSPTMTVEPTSGAVAGTARRAFARIRSPRTTRLKSTVICRFTVLLQRVRPGLEAPRQGRDGTAGQIRQDNVVVGRLVCRDEFEAVSSEIPTPATQTTPGLRRRAMRSHRHGCRRRTKRRPTRRRSRGRPCCPRRSHGHARDRGCAGRRE